MTHWPAHVEPLNRAILELLEKIPPHWGAYAPASFSATEQEAVRLMVRAGLLELRLGVHAEMVGCDETLEMTVTISGEYGASDIWKRVFRQVPHWLDEHGQTRGHCQLASEPQQIRLTDQGELARHDHANQSPENPSAVCAFVRRQGMFTHRPPVEVKIHVEACRVRAQRAEQNAPAMTVAGAQAVAQTSVGDINVVVNVPAGLAAGSTPAPEAEPADRPEADPVQKPRRSGNWDAARVSAGIEAYLEAHWDEYLRLGGRCLAGRRGALKALGKVFGPTAIARGINKAAGVTDPQLGCGPTHVSGNETYRTRIKPLRETPPRKPMGWPRDRSATTSLADEITAEIEDIPT